jgi:hypothetical protein
MGAKTFVGRHKHNGRAIQERAELTRRNEAMAAHNVE